jgi:hypothetical protein
MFHFVDPLHGHVFTFEDPRTSGFTGVVDEGVLLENGLDYAWKDGNQRPQCSLGISPNNPKQYRAFKSRKECQDAGFKFLGDNTHRRLPTLGLNA